MNCPHCGWPLFPRPLDMYRCDHCHNTWHIAIHTESFTFNRNAPGAQLVMDADRILGAGLKHRHITTPPGDAA